MLGVDGEEPTSTELPLGKNIHGGFWNHLLHCLFVFLVPLASSLPTQRSPGDLRYVLFSGKGAAWVLPRLCGSLGLWEPVLLVAELIPNSSFIPGQRGRIRLAGMKPLGGRSLVGPTGVAGYMTQGCSGLKADYSLGVDLRPSPDGLLYRVNRNGLGGLIYSVFPATLVA